MWQSYLPGIPMVQRKTSIHILQQRYPILWSLYGRTSFSVLLAVTPLPPAPFVWCSHGNSTFLLKLWLSLSLLSTPRWWCWSTIILTRNSVWHNTISFKIISKQTFFIFSRSSWFEILCFLGGTYFKNPLITLFFLLLYSLLWYSLE